MNKKRFNVKPKITALILSVLLLIGTVPITVSAAQTRENYILLNGMNADAVIKTVNLPFTNKEKQLAVMLMDNPEEAAYSRMLCYSISDGVRVSLPTSFKDDGTSDLQPFVYSQSGISSINNDTIITWTGANKKFNFGTPKTEDEWEKLKREIANSMRINIAVMNSEKLTFPFESYVFSGGVSNNVCHYQSRVTRVNGKTLITWAVCKDIKNNDGFFAVEGMYYNPDTNTFSTDTNEKDEKGNLIPMSFVENRNYISDYSVAYINGKTAVLFREATDGTRIADEMYNSVMNSTDNYPYEIKDSDKNKDLNLAVSNTVTTLAPSGKYSSIVKSSMPYLSYYYNNNIYGISPYNANPEGWRTQPILNVAETGDTKYSFIINNYNVEYIAALEITPLKTDKTNVGYGKKYYEKTEDGKWIDEKGDITELYQQNVRLYYRGTNDNQMSLLPLPLLDTDGNAFTCMPSFVIDSENRLATVWAYENVKDELSGSRVSLYHTRYSQENLLKANYSSVNTAIAKANALNKDDYTDFSQVENAVNAVVYDKSYKEQSTVNLYAENIEKAIDALTLKSADYTEVDAAIARANSLDENLYKDFSAVENAITAVDRSKSFKQQSDVDAMANAINEAIAALKYKDADYTEVDEALSKANALNPSDYRDFSQVEAAVNSVIRGKNITEQAKVDLMAERINSAVAALERIPEPSYENPTVKPETKSEQKTEFETNNKPKPQTKSPETGSSVLAMSALSITAGAFLLYFKKRKK